MPVRTFVALVLIVSGWTACATTSETVKAPPPSSPQTGEPAAKAAAAPPSPARQLSDTELAIWNDPSFQKRFVESYLAETEVEPRLNVVEREQMQKVAQLMASDKVDRAITLLEKNRGEAATAVYDYTLGTIFLQQDQMDAAADALQTAVEKHPKFLRAWQNLGFLHSRRGQFERAVPALTKVIELGGGSGSSYGMLGFAYSNLGNDLAAESAYRMAVLLEPDTMLWKRGLAVSLFKQRRFADAVALFDSLIEEHPDSAELWLAQANAYIGRNEPLKAAENYEVVDRLGGSTVGSLNNLGDIYTNEKLYEMAAEKYIRAFEKDPEGMLDRAMRSASQLVARSAHDEGLRVVDRIEERMGEQLDKEQRTDLLRLRARVAVARGAGDEEARVLKRIVELDPLDGDALILLGDHERRSGNVEKAILYYERAAKLEEFEAKAKKNHAQLLVAEERYADALPLLRRVQSLNPSEGLRDYLDKVERIAKTAN